MKYCTKCGAGLDDDARFCTQCGSATYIQPTDTSAQQSQVSNFKTISKVFMIISCVITGFYIIPLFWTIPMTVHYSKCIKEHKTVGTGFKVCAMLFVSLVAGILMLCDNQD